MNFGIIIVKDIMETVGLCDAVFVSTRRSLLLAVLLFGAVSAQQYPYYAGVFSSAVALNCTSQGQTDTLIWKAYTAGTTNDQILILCNAPNSCTNYNSNEYTSSVYPPLYGLGISELDVKTSTKYTCTVLNSSGTQTVTLYYTIALERLACPQSGTLVSEGTPILMTCTSVYYQYLMDTDHVVRPVLTWANGMGSKLTEAGVTNLTDTQTSYTINITMTADYDGVPFSCNLTFPSTTGLTYTDNCQVSYQIAQGVTSVNPGLDTTGGVPTLNVGDVLNCTANGKPQPTIKWIDRTGIQLSSISTLVVSDQLVTDSQPVTCTCVAYNFINGVDYEVFSNVTFYVQKNSAVVQSASVEGWVIAISVCIPLIVLIVTVIVGYWFYRHRQAKKVKKSGNKSTTTYTAVNTSPDPYITGIAMTNVSSAPNTNSNNGNASMESGVQTPAGGYGALGAQYYQGSNSVLNCSASSYIPITGPAYMYNPRQVQGGATKQPAYPYKPQQDAKVMNPYPNTRPTPVPPCYPYTGPSRQASGSSPVPPPSYPYSGQTLADTTLTGGSRYTSNQESPAFVPPVRRQISSQGGSVSASEV